MTKEDFIHSTILVEQEHIKAVREVRIAIPVKEVTMYYEYPWELDEVLGQDGTKVFCANDNFIIKMTYDEFQKVYFQKLEAINKREGFIKSN